MRMVSEQQVRTEENLVNTSKLDSEQYDYQAEVSQIMSLLINSVYSSKEMFLRELISNSSDALSKIIANKNNLDQYPIEPIGSLKIQIIPDKANNTLTIRDNGIGLTKSDLIAFLGTIANSGTKAFKQMLDSQNDKANLDSLIGQFGLGFYSAFLVADRIDVITKHPMDEGYIWSSECGKNSFQIAKYDVGDLCHGTSVVLTMKSSESEYLDSSKIINLVKKYSQCIKFPITVLVEKEEKIEEEEEKAEEAVEVDENDAVIEKPEDKKEVKTRKILEEQTINKEVSIWTRKLDQIPEQDLKAFYKNISNDYEDYLAVQSWHFEGFIDLKIVLFIPKRNKMSFFEKPRDKSTSIKLYSSNVFITDNLSRETVPEWMDFVVGAISSSNFPMNISRELLQGNSVMNLLKTKLPKCIAEMIKKLEKDSEKYNEFYKEYASNIKLAIRHYSDTQQEAFAKFLRYPTNNDPNTSISLDEYLQKVDESQKQILYLTGLNKKDVENSLCLESFKDRLVLLMSEPVDEFMLQGLRKYKELDFQNISVEGVESAAPLSEEANADYTPMIGKTKDVLNDRVEKVVVSDKPSDIPVSIISTKYGNSSTLENILKAQPNTENNPMLMMMLKSKKILVVNVEHPLIKDLKKLFDDGNEEQFAKMVNFLYNSALIGGGYTLDDKSSFIKDLYSILSSKNE